MRQGDFERKSGLTAQMQCTNIVESVSAAQQNTGITFKVSNLHSYAYSIL